MRLNLILVKPGRSTPVISCHPSVSSHIWPFILIVNLTHVFYYKRIRRGLVFFFTCLCLNFAEVETKGETDCLDERQLSEIVNKDELVKVTAKHCPSHTIAFWISEAEMDKTEIELGQEIRLKTKGDGPFVCEFCMHTLKNVTCLCQLKLFSLFLPIVSFAKLDGGTVTKCNFAGDENAGASWTDKIMANKADAKCTGKSAGQGEGADEDEWVRFSPMWRVNCFALAKAFNQEMCLS